MMYADSPVAADVARHYRSVDERDAFYSAIDARSDAIREEMDWRYLEELVTNGPEAQRREFWTQCRKQLMEPGAQFLRGALAQMAEPLQDCVAICIEERARRELAKERADTEAAIEESIHGNR